MLSRRSLAAALTAALAAPVLAVSTSAAVASSSPTAASTATSTATTATTAGAPAASASPGNRLHAKPLPRPHRGKTEHSKHAQGKVLVEFKRSASQASRDKAVRNRGAKAVGRVAGTDVVELQTSGSAEDLASRLRGDSQVAQVGLDYIRTASVAPNDLAYAYGDQPYLNTVRMPSAWDRQKGSTSQIIAVVDTGVYGGHPDLAGRVLAGFNAITDTAIPAGAASDDNGHGSMVAGIAGANTNNTEGIAGVAWNARIMPVKVLDAQGDGTDSDVIQGIRWAADKGAKVINLSLGGADDSPFLHDAVTYAVSKGAVVVAAAGNTGADQPEYPAAYAEVVAVAATDKDGRLTDFSTHGDWVDVAAPGFDIVSTWRTYDYYVGSGTSFSAPIVSGIAALIRAQYPTYTPAQVAARLRTTARDAGPRGIDPFYGAGIVDATYAVGGTWAADFPQPSAGVNEPNDVPARAVVMADSATGAIGAEGDVDWYRYESASARSVDVLARPSAYEPTLAQNVDMVVSVYDQDLRLIGVADSYAEGELETLSFFMGKGTYYLAVRNYNGSRDTRTYSLGVVDTPAGVFDPAASISLPAAPASAVAVGDVTGDGRADILAGPTFTNTPSAPLYVLPQQDDGTPGAPVPYQTVDAALPNNIVVSDVNGDHRNDVVLSTSIGVQVLTQSETGTLEQAAVVPGATGTYVAAGDLDADGRVDLVTSSYSDVATLMAQPDGSWRRTTVSDSGGYEIELGDLDGDGQVDVAVKLNNTGVRVLHNTADGWSATDHLVGTNFPTHGIEVADITGDSRADLVGTIGGNPPNSQLVVWPQAADGTLAGPSLLPVADSPETVEAGDIDGDGRIDLVSAHGIFRKVSVLTQQADGTLAKPITSQMGYADYMRFYSLALGDLSDDGQTDAVVASNAGIDLLRNAGGPTSGGEQLWVRSTTPSDFGSGMTLTYLPTVTFQRDVDPAYVTNATVGILNGRTGARVPASVTYDPATRVATIKPTSPLYDAAPYRLLVSGVKDTDGNQMTTPITSTFRTTDVTPPAVGSFTATGALRAATLAWKAPAITDLDGYIVRMATGATPPADVSSGTALYSGTSTAMTASNLTGAVYSFRVWVKDRAGKLSPAASAKLVGTAVSMTSNVTSLTSGGSVTVSGKVTRRDTGAAIAGAPAELYWRRVGTTTWTLAATRTSSSTGAVSFAHKPTASVDYMWVYRGSTAYVGSSSALRRVGVKTAVTATASRTSVALGGTFTLTGSVSPAHAGKTVYLQRYAGNGTWTTVTSKALSSTSTYSFSVKPTARGTATYRVYKPADTDHLAGYSPNRAVKVT